MPATTCWTRLPPPRRKSLPNISRGASRRTIRSTAAITPPPVLTRSLSGTITGDVVSLTGGTATFADKTVGTGKSVTLTGASLSGADALNYVLDSVATTTADITTAAITATLTAANKTYDGTTTEPNANMSCMLNGVLPTDT